MCRGRRRSGHSMAVPHTPFCNRNSPADCLTVLPLAAAAASFFCFSYSSALRRTRPRGVRQRGRARCHLRAAAQPVLWSAGLKQTRRNTSRPAAG